MQYDTHRNGMTSTIFKAQVQTDTSSAKLTR